MQNVILATRLKERCKAKRCSMKKLLEDCNLNRNAIYDIETRGSFPSSDRLSKIADYLDCSVDYLLGRTDIPEVNRGEIYNEESIQIAALNKGTKSSKLNVSSDEANKLIDEL